MVWVTCVLHGLHNIADEVRKAPNYSLLNKVILGVKGLFKNTTKRRHAFCEFRNANFPELGKNFPPEPAMTRWATFFDASKWYACARNLECITEFVKKGNLGRPEEQPIQLHTAEKEIIWNKRSALKVLEDRATYEQAEEVTNFFESNGLSVTATTKRLQARDFVGLKAIQEYDNTINHILGIKDIGKIQRAPGKKKRKNKEEIPFPQYVAEKRQNNEEFIKLQNFWERGVECTETTLMNPDERKSLQNAPIVSAESERGFSEFNAFFRSNRRRLNFKTIQQKMVTKELLNKVLYIL